MTFVDEYMRKALENHELVHTVNHPYAQVYRLRHPKYSRLEGCLVIFSTESITITGDLTPGFHGVCSQLGYDLNWFAGKLSEDYLCSKFLQTEFRPDKAEQRFKQHLIYRRRLSRHANSLTEKHRREHDYFTQEEAREAWDEFKPQVLDGLNVYRFCEFWGEKFSCDWPPDGCYGYNLGDASCLCAIQQRFHELYTSGRVVELADTADSKPVALA